MSEPARHRWLDEFKGAGSERLRELVRSVVTDIEQFENRTGARARARRAVDQKRFSTAVEVIVSNLAHAVLLPPDTGRLAVTTGNPLSGHSRYQNPALGKTLRDILWRMQELEYLQLYRPASMRGEATSMAVTPKLAKVVLTAGVSLNDFCRVAGEETIVLSMKSGRIPIDYQDTPHTRAMRADMEALNSFLTEADVTFIDDGLGTVDISQTTMRRHFRADTPEDRSFDKNGRLFGGWWQHLKSSRRGQIRVQGEKTAILDYSSMFARLAYAKVGAPPPPGDIYAIPGLEGHRKAVKLAVNCLFFDTNRHRSSWPVELTQLEPGAPVDAVMPAGWTVARFRTALLTRHPALSETLGRGIGLQLMYMESVILAEVLKTLRLRGIVGLGLHDGVIVPQSRGDEVKEVMVETAKVYTSAVLPVTQEAVA